MDVRSVLLLAALAAIGFWLWSRRTMGAGALAGDVAPPSGNLIPIAAAGPGAWQSSIGPQRPNNYAGLLAAVANHGNISPPASRAGTTPAAGPFLKNALAHA